MKRQLTITLLILSISTNFAYPVRRAAVGAAETGAAAARTAWQRASGAARTAAADTGSLAHRLVKPAAETLTTGARATDSAFARGTARVPGTAPTGLTHAARADQVTLRRPIEFMQSKQPAPAAPKLLQKAGTLGAAVGIAAATAPVAKGVIQRRGPAHAEVQPKRYGTEEERLDLLVAVGNGDAATVRKLIESGLDPNGDEDYAPISMAVTYGNFAMIDLLLELGADINKGGALYNIAYGDYKSKDTDRLTVAEYLVQHGANPNALYKGKSPLFIPLNSTDIYEPDEDTLEILTFLIKHGANPNITDERGNTPLNALVGDRELHDTVHYERETISICTEYAKVLINNGADVNKPDSWGNTPLLSALKILPSGGQMEGTTGHFVGLLLENNANTNTRNARGESPLITVIDHYNSELIPVLMKHGAKPDEQDKNRDSAIVFAVKRGSTDAITQFKDAGLRIGQELVATALTNDKPDMAQFLLEINPGIDSKVNYAQLLAITEHEIDEFDATLQSPELHNPKAYTTKSGRTLYGGFKPEKRAALIERDRQRWETVRDALKARIHQAKASQATPKGGIHDVD